MIYINTIGNNNSYKANQAKLYAKLLQRLFNISFCNDLLIYVVTFDPYRLVLILSVNCTNYIL